MFSGAKLTLLAHHHGMGGHSRLAETKLTGLKSIRMATPSMPIILMAWSMPPLLTPTYLQTQEPWGGKHSTVVGRPDLFMAGLQGCTERDSPY